MVKKRFLFFGLAGLFLLVSVISLATASDGELTMVCGGDSELVMHCLGNAELDSLGIVTEEKQGGEKLQDHLGLNFFYVIGGLLIIFLILFLIFKRRKKEER